MGFFGSTMSTHHEHIDVTRVVNLVIQWGNILELQRGEMFEHRQLPKAISIGVVSYDLHRIEAFCTGRIAH